MAQSRLRSLGEGDTSEFFQQTPIPDGPPGWVPPQPPSSPAEHAATSILLTSLRALSQRALVALSSLFVLITAISAWWLWMTVLPSPSVNQLIGLALYGLLVLAVDWLVLRRG